MDIIPLPGQGRSAPLVRAPGRPRNETIDRQVVAAVLTVLRTRGYRGVTIEGIARRVRRPRSSLYRRWPSKPHLVAYCIVSTLGARPAADGGALGQDLRAAVGTLRRAFSGALGQALPGLVADMAHDRELAEAVRREVLAPRRQSMRAAFARAAHREQAGETLNVELLLDMLTAPFYFRALFGHAQIDRQMVRDVVRYILRIVARAGGTAQPACARRGRAAR